MSRKYSYKIKNIATDEQIEHVLGAVKGINGVLKAEIKGELLTYVIVDQIDEYDVLVAAVNSADEVGGEVIVGEEETLSDYDYDAEYDYSEPSVEGKGEADEEGKNADNRPIDEDIAKEDGFEKVEEGFEEVKGYDDEYEEEDRIVAAKKKIKTQTITRFVELSVSIVCLVVSFFLKSSTTTFLSFKNILQILSFALAAYEVLYNAVIDVFKKRWFSENIYVGVSFMLAALLGLVGEVSIIALVFAVGKEIETYMRDINELRVDDNFYTGSLPVTLTDGDKKAIKDIEAGDEIVLERYDVLPCDGEVLSDATFDCYKMEKEVEKKVSAGEKVFAGSILLSDGVTVKASAANADSMISQKRKAFEEKLTKYCKTPLFVRLITPCAFLVALAFTFVLSAFYKGGYGQGLLFYGPIGLLIVFAGLISYLVSAINNCAKNAVIICATCNIDFKDKSAYDKLERANSFVFDAEALTENDGVKDDAFGALKELLSIGAKNVTTNFDTCSLSYEVREKIDFVDNAFAGEKKIAVGEGKDVSLDDSGKIAVSNGEISFVPLAYKLVKRSKKAKTAAIIINVLAYLGAVAMAIFLNSIGVLFAALPVVAAAVVAQICALGCLSDKV